jgi:hypothetical protein
MRVMAALRTGHLARAHAASVLACISILCSGSIASAQSEAPPPPPIPALDIDPTEEIDVRGWWSNGRELLLIETDGKYKLWKGTNRFVAPDDVGRWDRQTYRTLWLETYRAEKHSRDRAHLRREDGKLLMSLRDLEPMQQLARPPHTREDTIVGVWSGPPGTLTLRDDGTYSLEVQKPGAKDRQPVRLGSHSGTWLVRDDTVVLSQGAHAQPVVAGLVVPAQDPPQPPTLPAPEGTRIVLPGGELKREPPRPAGTT